MSVQAITWAINYPAENATEKAILLVLANYADGDGYCYPGQQSIARQSACSERTVRRVMDDLEARGVIKRVERRGTKGQRTSNATFLVAFSQPDTVSGRGEPTGHPVQTYRTSCPNLPDTVSGIYKDEPSVEPSVEPSGAREASTPDLAEQIWSLQPVIGGKRRATRPDVRKALDAALKRKGNPSDILAALQAYYRLPDCRKDEGRYASGAAVMLNNDRWRDFLPQQRTTAPSGSVDPLIMARRMTRYRDTGVWEHGWGEKPREEKHHTSGSENQR